ncbi:MAG TPA: phenylalanine--tRNA ligase subunit alpha [Gemmatimonadales bacterium]|nr:phenylalanine--tRNA ligase subunit alpha [Gemmatimonadales bacterium]
MTTGYPELDALLPRLEQIPTLDAAALEGEQIALLGRKGGALTLLLRRVAELPLEERRAFGAALNRLKADAEERIAARRAELDAQRRARAEAVDLTMPARRRWTGSEHPVTRVVDEILDIFRQLGFVVAVGPEVETDWYNFGALNFPPDHPAMDLHDTLYLDAPPVDETPGAGRLLLRTHTSPVQIRTLLASPPPIRAVMPGWTYRNDAFDPSHAPAFLQIEGLAVDEGISFVDLKATLVHFAHRFFSPTTKVRFRPSYFPFTEPSAEMDVECQLCHGGGCPACKGTGWMEILGCGMVHPSVIRVGGADAERNTGFAFGMGPHRVTMLRHGLPDIRLLYEGDMRFLEQFVPDGRTAGRPDGPEEA